MMSLNELSTEELEVLSMCTERHFFETAHYAKGVMDSLGNQSEAYIRAEKKTELAFRVSGAVSRYLKTRIQIDEVRRRSGSVHV
jgi:hypothetical protein